MVAVVLVVGAAWMFRQMDLRRLGEAFAGIHWRWLPLVVGAYLISFMIRAWRWGLLLPGEVGFGARLGADFGGFMVAFIMPLRAGEVARVWMISQWGGVRFAPALGSLVVERVLDVLVVIGALAWVFSGAQNVPFWMTGAARGLVVIACLGMVGLAAVYGWRIRFEKWCMAWFPQAEGTAKWRMGIGRLAMGVLEGVAAVKSPARWMVAVVGSVVLWAMFALMYQFGIPMMGIDAPDHAGIAVMVMVALAVAAPGPPGFLGTFQAGCIAALALYGVGKEQALSYSIIMHAIQAAVLLPAGWWALHAHHVKLGEAKAAMNHPRD